MILMTDDAGQMEVARVAGAVVLIVGAVEARVAARGGGSGGTGRLEKLRKSSIPIFGNIETCSFLQVSATETTDPLPGTKEEGELPRKVAFNFLLLSLAITISIFQVNNQVLVEMARDIRPPPLEPSEVTAVTGKSDLLLNLLEQVRSPRGAKGRAGRGQKESKAAFGPMPNFEREVQRIIAEQEIVSKVKHNSHKYISARLTLQKGEDSLGK